MNWIFAILIALQLACTHARPADDVVEIEKQRLVKFPEETFRIEENEQKTFEAKRILEEIDKINVALGYVKKQEPSLPSILDSNQFLFPKPAYHPFHPQSNGGILQPSIRSLSPYSNQFPNQNSKLTRSSPKPKLFFYYYLPKNQELTYELPNKQADVTKDEYTIQNSPRTLKLIDYKVVGDFQDALDNKQQKLTEINSPKLRLYFVPRDLKVNEKSMDYLKNEKLIKIEKLPTIRPFSKATTDKQKPNAKPSNSQKYVTPPSTTTTKAPPAAAGSLKTPFGSFFHRRPGQVVAQSIEAKPVLQAVPLSSPQYNPQQQQQLRPDPISSDDYKWDADSSEESDYPQDYEKHIFSAKRKEMAEVQKEALKESGIIIQRLKVRKGGIAIAGPGGVATAGSGGTAIVGPGGYALTHPRSLTIAGPGAKVIAIPQSTDLKDVIQRTNAGRSYTDEGEVVATGPVIYYSPDDNSQF